MHVNQIKQLAREIAEQAVVRASTSLAGVVEDLQLSDSDRAVLRAQLAAIAEEVARGPGAVSPSGGVVA